MADIEKTPEAHGVESPTASELPPPTGWKYRPLRIGAFSLPCYASPPSQLFIVAMVCFLCPGMFNALGATGGGGQIDPHTADKANVALYSTFAVVGFLAGSIVNRAGIKASLSFGGLGYCIYVASFLCYNHTQNAGFNIFAGALLGACAGVLWAAQGTIMLSYPPERSKGRYIAWFWIIFNLGGVIGGLIVLGQNIHVKAAGTVSDGTYIGFLILTFAGACLAWCLIDSKNIVRNDGSRVIAMKHPTVLSELKGLVETFRLEPYIVLLFPMFWVSNWFYTYQFNSVNAARFDVRTRALNSTLYWAAQMVGALIFGYGLDYNRVNRRTRARGAWTALFVLTMAIWGGGYAWQKNYTRASAPKMTSLDWSDKDAVGGIFLMIFYGFYDAAWQTTIYWFMGAFTNNGRRLANYVGFYKGIQSAGAAVQWRADDLNESYMAEFASNWALLAGSLLIALPLVLLRIKDTVSLEADLQFTDETIADVQPSSATAGTIEE